MPSHVVGHFGAHMGGTLCPFALAGPIFHKSYVLALEEKGLEAPIFFKQADLGLFDGGGDLFLPDVV